MSWWAFGAQALGSIFGAQADRAAAAETNKQNAYLAHRNELLQRDFAENGIKWKVEDAKRAGVHPLVALGAPTASASPSMVGGHVEASKGDMYRNMGQDLGRAISATQSAPERELAALQLTAAKLDIEGKALDNQYRASQIQKSMSPPQIGPPLPSPMDSGMGAGQTGFGYKVKPAEITASAPGVPSQEAGAVNDYGFVRTPTGYAIVPSKDVKERIEDQFVPEMMWSIRNQIAPALSGHPAPNPKQYPLPKGATEWRWNALSQEFQPYYPERAKQNKSKVHPYWRGDFSKPPW